MNVDPSGSDPLLEFGGSDVNAVDTVMELLADRRRRAVLQYLERTDGTATIAELAEELAIQEQEAESPPAVVSDYGAVSERDVRAVRLSLHHVHVPKLAEADAIDYDSETKLVTLRDRGRILLSRQNAICGSIQ